MDDMIKKLSRVYKTNHTLFNNLVGVVILKGLSLVLTFVMTPMYLEYFSDESYLGVWYTILSILTWILTFDFGIGNGLRNKLAESITDMNQKRTRQLISSAYVALGILTAILSVISFVCIRIFDWQSILNSDISNNVLTNVILITVIGLLLQFFVKLVTSILFALKKNVIANSTTILTNLLIFVYLLIDNSGNNEQKILRLAFVYSIATLLPLVIATLYVFIRPCRKYVPTVRMYDRYASREVLSLGGAFFAIQLCLLVLNSTNQLLVSHLFDNRSVVDYTIYHRLFGMATMVLTLFTQPIWSEISVKLAQKDFEWIKKTYKAMIALALVICFGCIVVAWNIQFVFRIWLGAESAIEPDRFIAMAFVFWCIVDLLVMVSTCVANGISELKCQVRFTLIAAALKIPITFLLAKVYDSWFIVIIAHSLIMLPLMIAQMCSLNRWFYRKRNLLQEEK